MRLKLTLFLIIVAAVAFSIGTQVKGQPPEAKPRKATIGLVGYPLFFVDKALPNSPAENAGLNNGDLVLSINDTTIDSPEALKKSMAQVQPGQKIDVKYMRYKAADNQYYIYTVTVKAAERP